MKKDNRPDSIVWLGVACVSVADTHEEFHAQQNKQEGKCEYCDAMWDDYRNYVKQEQAIDPLLACDDTEF